MKRVLFVLVMWLMMLAVNGCVAVAYPDGYWEWNEPRRREYHEHHRLRPWEHYEHPREEHREENFEHR